MTELQDEHEAELLGEDVSYRVVRSENATKPRLDINIHDVKVVLPTDSDVDPEGLLEENANWVLKQKRKYDDYRERAPERQFEVGETFPFLGYDFEIETGEVSRPRVGAHRIVLPEARVEREGLREVLREFYRSEAKAILRERVQWYAEQLDVEYESIAVRNQRTRWGSCSAKKNLSFNWRLVMAPIDVLDYVVIHELVHLREKNHTDRFWRLVREFDEDYKAHAEWLEEHSVDLIFSQEDL